MPTFDTFSLSRICGLFDEAIRTIPGYDKYDPNIEPKALIDYSKTKDNFMLFLNNCMRHKKGEHDKSKKIRKLIEEKTGKTARKDAVACSVIITMPTTYEGDPKLFFDVAAKAMMIAAGIKEDDVLYAVVHMDESTPHMHFAFLPSSYVRDYEHLKKDYEAKKDASKAAGNKLPPRPANLKGELNRKIDENEKPVGMNCGRFGKAFLHTLNMVLEQRMAEMGIECKIGNGKGSQFKVEQMLKVQREESVAQAKRVDYLTKEVEKLRIELERTKNLPLSKTIINTGRLEELETIEQKYKEDLPKIERAERDLKAAAESMKAYSKAYERYQKEKIEFDKTVNDAANKKVDLIRDKTVEFIKSLGLWERFELYQENPIQAKGIKM